jgi:hypothetical protein
MKGYRNVVLLAPIVALPFAGCAAIQPRNCGALQNYAGDTLRWGCASAVMARGETCLRCPECPIAA